jgi:hypothetical protein
MSTEALEPKLTAFDRKVLAAIPESGGDENKWRCRQPGEYVTVWELGEALESLDLTELLTELNGLMHLGYVLNTFSRSRGRRVYWRTRKGDEATREREPMPA